MDAFDLRLRERLARLDAAAPAPWPPTLGVPEPRVRTRLTIGSRALPIEA